MIGNGLSTIVQRRLWDLGAPVEMDHDERGVIATLGAAYFVCRPGVVRLEPYAPVLGRPWTEMAIGPPRASVFDPTVPLTDVAVQRFVLIAKQWGLHITVQVTEPVLVIHDHSNKWKRHPPSKRKRMRSWRRAPDSERRRYAPLRGRRHVPWQWRHPDEGRKNVLGDATVRQAIYVYAQEGSPIDEQLQRHSDEWCSRVMEALS
jgi:hypothetical protein